MADTDLQICLYTDGLEALQSLADLGVYPPYLPECPYTEPGPEYAGDGSPVVDGFDRVVWHFQWLDADQVTILEAYKRKHVYVKTPRYGQYVVREAWLTGWEARPGPAPLLTTLTLTFTKVRPVT
jgi:hypothetical protein